MFVIPQHGMAFGHCAALCSKFHCLNMSVLNVHERILDASLSEVASLVDGLASDEDALWPFDRWPAMKFDRPLGVGAAGGHGPIRYLVESYEPGSKVCFRFKGPKGFVGQHRFEIAQIAKGKVRLQHTIEMRTIGSARLTWPLVYRPLHNALIEDALDRAESYVGGDPKKREWSLWVKVLRWLVSRSRPSTQRRKATA